MGLSSIWMHGPFKNKSKSNSASCCKNETVRSKHSHAHSVVYGKLVEHIHRSKCNLHHQHHQGWLQPMHYFPYIFHFQVLAIESPSVCTTCIVLYIICLSQLADAINRERYTWIMELQGQRWFVYINKFSVENTVI